MLSFILIEFSVILYQASDYGSYSANELLKITDVSSLHKKGYSFQILHLNEYPVFYSSFVNLMPVQSLCNTLSSIPLILSQRLYLQNLQYIQDSEIPACF